MLTLTARLDAGYVISSGALGLDKYFAAWAKPPACEPAASPPSGRVGAQLDEETCATAAGITRSLDGLAEPSVSASSRHARR